MDSRIDAIERQIKSLRRDYQAQQEWLDTICSPLHNGVTLCRKCHNKTKGKEIKFELFFAEYIKLINYTRS